MGRAPHGDARGEQPFLAFVDRLSGQHAAHDLVDGIEVGKLRQRPDLTRQIDFCGARYAERAKAVVAGVVQILEDGEPRRPVKQADHALSPPVRPCVVDRTRSRVLHLGKIFAGVERKVLAEREPVCEPVAGIA